MRIMKRFFLRRFFMSIVCFLCVIGLIAAIIVTAVITTMSHDIQSRMLRNLETSSQNIKLLMDNGNFQQALLTFESSVSSTIRDVLESDSLTYKDIPIRDLLKYTVYSPTILSEHIESVYLYVPNAKGNFLSSSQLVQNLQTAIDRSWYASYLGAPDEQDVWVSSRIEGHYDFETPREVISVYQRLSFSAGVLVLNILPDSLADAISLQALHQDETALLFNAQGSLLLSTRDEPITQGEYSWLLGNVSEDKISNCKIGGSTWFVTKKTISRYGLTYFLLSSKDSVYKSVSQILIFCGVAILIAILVSILLSWHVTKRNAERLNEVIALFARAEQGQKIPTLLESNRDEYDIIINNITKTFLRHSYLNLQLQNRYQEAKIAQLTALQLQINPHFLFNTLQIIDFEVLGINKKHCDANVLIKRLSNILMYCLRNTDCAVTLGEEIERTKDYLFIQQYRKGKEALRIEWCCASEIEEIPCLCMILQPFLENSIMHGQRLSGEPLRIRISIRPTPDKRSVRIRLLDNGCGMSQAQLRELLSAAAKKGCAETSKHIGIRNTIIRLELFCGERLCFRIHSIENLGTMVAFDIPIDC